MVSRDFRKGTSLAALLSLLAASCAAAHEANVAPTVPTTSANIATTVDSPGPDAAELTQPPARARVPVAAELSNALPKTAPPVDTASNGSLDAKNVPSGSDSVAVERRSVEALDRVSALIPFKHEKRGAVMTLSTDDLFEPGDWRLSSAASNKLDDLSAALRLQGDKTIEIDGFTDSLGDAAENDDLSTRRADALRDYFAQKGVESSKMKTAGLGSRRPVADNATAFGRAQNRRVEIVIENAPRASSESRGAVTLRADARFHATSSPAPLANPSGSGANDARFLPP
jgi:outer membrane protein OmpA-like peptidoglycan-associated protein